MKSILRKGLLAASALLLAAVGYAQQSEKFSGKLLEKPWSKSTQSYCAGGSEYYVLDHDDTQTVLKVAEKDFPKLAKHKGKKVEIVGKMVTKTIKSDPMSQQPVGSEDGFTCMVLEIESLSSSAGKVNFKAGGGDKSTQTKGGAKATPPRKG